MRLRAKILIYGDSNTWGELAFSGQRLPHDEQWPNVLQKLLGDEFVVVQEGLAARIAGDYLDSQNEIYLNGQRYFEVAFYSATPVDVVIVALGVNDLNLRRRAKEIYDDLMWYKDEVDQQIVSNEGVRADVIFIAPHAFVGFGDDYKDDFEELNNLLKERDDVIFLEGVGLSADEVHFSTKGHKQVANQVYKYLIKKGVV